MHPTDRIGRVKESVADAGFMRGIESEKGEEEEVGLFYLEHQLVRGQGLRCSVPWGEKGQRAGSSADHTLPE